jgi:ribosomal protein S1
VYRDQAYVEIEPGIEGVLPSEEYSETGADLTQVLTMGEMIPMVVFDVNPDQRLIYVSRRRYSE